MSGEAITLRVITRIPLPNKDDSSATKPPLILPDDLPLAVRSHLSASKPKVPFVVGLAKALSIALVASTAVSALFLGPLRGWLTKPPVAGLDARLSADGRLLGHFPYPEATSSQLVEVQPGMFLRADAARDFLAMQQAASADGIKLVLLSAFRSAELQRKLFFGVKADRNQTASDRARVSAPPGFSEHSTGYAFDIGDLSNPQTNLSSSFSQTKAFSWLQMNAARYQFVLSFPSHNRQGLNYEPWHWRYEGSTDALRLFEPAHRLSRGGG